MSSQQTDLGKELPAKLAESQQTLPSMVNMLTLFNIYNDAANLYRAAIRGGDLAKAAECQAAMWKLDVFLADHRFEA